MYFLMVVIQINFHSLSLPLCRFAGERPSLQHSSTLTRRTRKISADTIFSIFTRSRCTHLHSLSVIHMVICGLLSTYTLCTLAQRREFFHSLDSVTLYLNCYVHSPLPSPHWIRISLQWEQNDLLSRVKACVSLRLLPVLFPANCLSLSLSPMFRSPTDYCFFLPCINIHFQWAVRKCDLQRPSRSPRDELPLTLLRLCRAMFVHILPINHEQCNYSTGDWQSQCTSSSMLEQGQSSVNRSHCEHMMITRNHNWLLVTSAMHISTSQWMHYFSHTSYSLEWPCYLNRGWKWRL